MAGRYGTYNSPSGAGNPHHRIHRIHPHPRAPIALAKAGHYAVTYRGCATVPKKNITVSVDEETYRRSRIKAAESGTSVSALVRSYLADLVAHGTPESKFDRLRRLQDETLEAIRSRGGGLRAADNLRRDALHQRDAFR